MARVDGDRPLRYRLDVLLRLRPAGLGVGHRAIAQRDRLGQPARERDDQVHGLALAGIPLPVEALDGAVDPERGDLDRKVVVHDDDGNAAHRRARWRARRLPGRTRRIDVQVQGLVALDDVVADDQQVRRDRRGRTRLGDERAGVGRREPPGPDQPGVIAAGRRPGVRDAVRIAASLVHRLFERKHQQRDRVHVGLDHLESAVEIRRIGVVVLDGDGENGNDRTAGRARSRALPFVDIDVQRLGTLDLVVAGDDHVTDDNVRQAGRQDERTARGPARPHPGVGRTGGAAPVGQLERKAVVGIGGLRERQRQRGRSVGIRLPDGELGGRDPRRVRVVVLDGDRQYRDDRPARGARRRTLPLVHVDVEGLGLLDLIVARDDQVANDHFRQTRPQHEAAARRLTSPNPRIRCASSTAPVGQLERKAVVGISGLRESQRERRRSINIRLPDGELRGGNSGRVRVVVLDGDRQYRDDGAGGPARRGPLPLVDVDVQRLGLLDLVVPGDDEVAHHDLGQARREHERPARRLPRPDPRISAARRAPPVGQLEREAVVRIRRLGEGQRQRRRGVLIGLDHRELGGRDPRRVLVVVLDGDRQHGGDGPPRPAAGRDAPLALVHIDVQDFGLLDLVVTGDDHIADHDLGQTGLEQERTRGGPPRTDPRVRSRGAAAGVRNLEREAVVRIRGLLKPERQSRRSVPIGLSNRERRRRNPRRILVVVLDGDLNPRDHHAPDRTRRRARLPLVHVEVERLITLQQVIPGQLHMVRRGKVLIVGNDHERRHATIGKTNIRIRSRPKTQRVGKAVVRTRRRVVVLLVVLLQGHRHFQHHAVPL